MKAALAPTYACTVCAARWTYDDVRCLARCRDCGGGLVRDQAILSISAPVPVAPSSRRRAAR